MATPEVSATSDVVVATDVPAPTVSATGSATSSPPSPNATVAFTPEDVGSDVVETVVDAESTRETVDEDVANADGRTGFWPSVTRIDERERSWLKAYASRTVRLRSNPVPIGEVLTSSGWSMRVVDVERTVPGAGSVCRAPAGYVCLRTEWEVTNIANGDEPRSLTHDDISVVGERGIVYAEGDWNSENCVSRCPYAELGYVERTTLEVIRHVPADENGFVLIYGSDASAMSFWLEIDPPSVDESVTTSFATPVPYEIGAAGTWTLNPVPVGSSVTVDGISVRIVEVERDWEPEGDCCDFSLPEVLLTSSYNDFVMGVSKDEAAWRVSRDDGALKQFEGKTQFVRVRIEATSVGSYNQRTLFDAANFILADGEGGLYSGGFYPNEETVLKTPSRGGYSDRGFLAPDGRDRRLAEVFGGGTVGEEIVWLVPRDATGLTLVYLPNEHEAGGFLALEDTIATAAGDGPPVHHWIEEALGISGTWPSRPAPFRVGVTYKEGAVVRVVEVESAPGGCGLRDRAIQGKDCLRVTFEVGVETSDLLRSIIGRDGVGIVLDDEAVTVQDRFDATAFAPLTPRFSSLLDWAEIGGRGTARATYSADVPSGWRDAMLVYRPQYKTPGLFLSLNEPAEVSFTEPDDSLRGNVLATVSAVS